MAAAPPPPRVVRGGLKLKGGLVIRAPPAAVSSSSTSSSATAGPAPTASLKRKLPSDDSAPSVKAESAASSTTSSSPPAPSSSSSSSLDPVKRTRALDEVEANNAALQALDKATERLDRGRLIADEKERAKALTAHSGAASSAASDSGVRLVDVSRRYVQHGFGDEARMHATAKLNAREKRKSDRYCK